MTSIDLTLTHHYQTTCYRQRNVYDIPILIGVEVECSTRGGIENIRLN